MSADFWAYALVFAGAFPATMIPLVLAARRAWHRTWLGRALMMQSTGLALLIDISLLYKAFGDDYPGRDAVRLTVYFLVIGGVWGLFLSLMSTERRSE